jgi:hypothetical protein
MKVNQVTDTVPFPFLDGRDILIDDLIFELRKMLEKYPDGIIRLDAGYNNISAEIEFQRPETLCEQQARLHKETVAAAQESKRKEDRRKLYDKLKKEFE